MDPGQLAYKAGISISSIHRIEAGERPNTSGVILGQIAEALQTTVDYLIGRTDDPGPVLAVPGTSAEVRRYVAELLDIWTELEQVAPDLLPRAVNLLSSQTELLLAAADARQAPEDRPPSNQEVAENQHGPH